MIPYIEFVAAILIFYHCLIHKSHYNALHALPQLLCPLIHSKQWKKQNAHQTLIAPILCSLPRIHSIFQSAKHCIKIKRSFWRFISFVLPIYSSYNSLYQNLLNSLNKIKAVHTFKHTMIQRAVSTILEQKMCPILLCELW